jgi:DNA-binding transcriptional ArsR family regulator
MIERLSRGPASVHGLTEPFALSHQMISKHISYLVGAGIVSKTKRGREIVCTLILLKRHALYEGTTLAAPYLVRI